MSDGFKAAAIKSLDRERALHYDRRKIEFGHQEGPDQVLVSLGRLGPVVVEDADVYTRTGCQAAA